MERVTVFIAVVFLTAVFLATAFFGVVFFVVVFFAAVFFTPPLATVFLTVAADLVVLIAVFFVAALARVVFTAVSGRAFLVAVFLTTPLAADFAVADLVFFVVFLRDAFTEVFFTAFVIAPLPVFGPVFLATAFVVLRTTFFMAFFAVVLDAVVLIAVFFVVFFPARVFFRDEKGDFLALACAFIKASTSPSLDNVLRPARSRLWASFNSLTFVIVSSSPRLISLLLTISAGSVNHSPVSWKCEPAPVRKSDLNQVPSSK